MSKACEGLRHFCGGCGFKWPERSAYDELVLKVAELGWQLAEVEKSRRDWITLLDVRSAELERAKAKADAHERDWYAAKIEFGDAMAAQRERLRAAEAREAETWGMVEAIVENVCAREYRACEGHAKSLGEVRPRVRMPVARAHTMAAMQSKAIGHYIKQALRDALEERKKRDADRLER